MKRIYKIIMMLTCMTILMLCKGTQVNAMTCGDYEFEVNKDGTATIIRYNGKDEVVEVPQTFVSGKGRTTLAPNTDVVIPNYIKIDGSKWVVTSIAKNAYKGNKYIKTVKIGKNVESIGKGAFKGCTKLKKVKMGKNVEKIGKSAFEGCKSLKKIIIPAATKKINKRAFFGCSKLATITMKSLHLRKDKVGAKAFQGVANNVSVKVTEGYEIIYMAIFQYKSDANKFTIIPF